MGIVMEKNKLLNLNMCVSDLLKDWPQVIPVFMRHNMACVGCSMSSFETLGDAAKIYGMIPESFLAELKQVIEASSSPS